MLVTYRFNITLDSQLIELNIKIFLMVIPLESKSMFTVSCSHKMFNAVVDINV